MKVEIFSIMKNEQSMLPFYLKHYQNKFSNCTINVYDNGSTDDSIQICKDASCNIGIFPVYTEELLKDWKNNIWKNSDADWIIVCDIDELLDMSMSDLLSLEESVNVIKTQGYNMIDVTEDDLIQAFSDFGQVESANVIKDKLSGESRGFGFVEMPSKDEANAAINGLNGKDLNGRAMNINEARPRAEGRDGRGEGGGKQGRGDGRRF